MVFNDEKENTLNSIAFVNSEYQQNILFSICMSKNINIDILFLTENITPHSEINRYANKIIYIRNIPFSWRSIKTYLKEYNKSILPSVNLKLYYSIFTWSYENPLVRLLINNLQTNKIYLLEDGLGSYIKRGLNKKELGVKSYLASKFIVFIIDLISGRVMSSSFKKTIGWSLYSNCFPGLNIKKEIIDHQVFGEVIKNAISNIESFKLEDETILFIQQPYVEMDILSQEEYISIHSNAMNKIQKENQKHSIKINWKLHPVTNFENEIDRVALISKKSGIDIEIIRGCCNIEYIAIMHKGMGITYYSLGSSSLYVIKALTENSSSVIYIADELLDSKVPFQSQITSLYKSMGINRI